MKQNSSEKLAKAVIYVFLFLVVISTAIPFYYVFVVSFATPAEYMKKSGMILWPQTWTFLSYEYMLFTTDAFANAIKISGFIAVVGTVLSLLINASFSYALSIKRFFGRKVILFLIMISILFHPGIIPPYLVVRKLGLINSIWSLIIPVLTTGWYVILMKGFFETIPQSLEEAAKIDGCNEIAAWWRIILPLSLPSLAAFGLFYAVAYWNTFFTAVLYINDPDKWTIQLLLRNMLTSSTAMGGDAWEITAEQYVPPETLKMAAIMIATMPILMVYPFLQKYFAKGIMLGSVKG